ncbi:VWA domain-containing protein [Paenarthrobacter sp. GOM3]|uniref:vWA domain-containing protein n=1 Tax=Paenarthrobacter sp. GOM3 TaxID=2782567 RepID=UPI001BAA17C7|nr:VWA domain-containing protein [Paenarthrobacter sp. GOM3]WOH17052.1 VWA domain-containing protein [Paenarthrobacter sp. GOM3]
MSFAPILPWPVLVLAGFGILILTAWTLVRQRGTRPHGRVRPAALRGAAVVLLLVAAMRPGLMGGQSVSASSEIDVFFVVDTSTSMAAEDYRGTETRLAGVKEDVTAVARELAGAKFSLITFDSKATVRMPLTQDATALQTAMATLQSQRARYASGSSVTIAAQLLKDRLDAAQKHHPGRPALVFYAGDGENTSAEPPPPMDASNVAGGAVLGYGTAEGGRMRESADGGAAYVKDRGSGTAQDAVSRIDEAQLGRTADQLHVPYAHRTGAEPAADILRGVQLGNLTTTTGDRPGRVELYWLFALAAFLLATHEPLRHFFELVNLRRSLRKEPTP